MIPYLKNYMPHPPFNGMGWRDVGISTEMICEFAEKRGINLHVFHGNKKTHQIYGVSDQHLTYFNGDNHCYFAENSMGYDKVTVSNAPRLSTECVKMERDEHPIRESRRYWLGMLEPGVLLTEDIQQVRNEWLQ